MKKIIPILLIALILISPILANDVHATTVFLTSDNVLGQSEDLEMLNDIKNQIETKSNGQITVIVDENASSPGEGTRAMNAECDLAVTIAYACAGNLVDLASYSTNSEKKIIYVNAGSLDLTDINFLRRSYDDNWSTSSFAAIKNPGQFLYDAGINLLQPTQKYPSESDNGNLDYSSSTINEYIAEEVVNQVYAEKTNSQLDSSLIVRHTLDPKYLAEDSKKIVDSYGGEMESSYGSYTTQQLLYMSASYLVGYGLEVPKSYEAPDNPSEYSTFTKNSYSFNDYCNMADIVVDYMNEHGKAPDSISYEGATIGYYDLVYNFALLTQDDTDASHMNFPLNSEFHKYNSNILLDILPIAIIIIIVIAVVLILRKIYRKIKGLKNRRNSRKVRNRYHNKQNGYNSQRDYKQSNYRNNNINNKRRGNNRNSRKNQRSRKNNKNPTRIFHKNVNLDSYDSPKRLNRKEKNEKKKMKRKK